MENGSVVQHMVQGHRFTLWGLLEYWHLSDGIPQTAPLWWLLRMSFTWYVKLVPNRLVDYTSMQYIGAWTKMKYIQALGEQIINSFKSLLFLLLLHTFYSCYITTSLIFHCNCIFFCNQNMLNIHSEKFSRCNIAFSPCSILPICFFLVD